MFISFPIPQAAAPGPRSNRIDALASLDFKLSVGQWVSESVIDIFFTATASMGLSDF